MGDTFDGQPVTTRDLLSWDNGNGTQEPIEEPKCLDRHQGDCRGAVEYRLPLSGTGRSFPRCDKHWDDRLEVQRGIDERYPTHPPADWSPLDAGESWYEED